MSFSVVVLSKNSANLHSCVEAVRKHEPEAEIVLIDDGVFHNFVVRTIDGKRETGWECKDVAKAQAFMDEYAPCTILTGYRNFVFARNANLGLRYSCEPLRTEVQGQFPFTITRPPRHDGVVLLNDDALLETPGGFTVMAKAAEEHPEVGIIGATTNVTGQPLQLPHGIGLRCLDHFAFVAVYIPQRTIQRIGYLDERYCLDYGVEDRDYAMACQQAGLKVCVHDGCYVDHGKLHSSFRGDPKTPRSYQQNYALFKEKWGVTA